VDDQQIAALRVMRGAALSGADPQILSRIQTLLKTSILTSNYSVA